MTKAFQIARQYAPGWHYWGLFFCALMPFTRELTVVIAGFEFDYVSYTFLLVSFALIILHNLIDAQALLIILGIFIVTFIAAIIAGTPLIDYLKYFAPAAVFYFTIYHLLYRYPVRSVFDLYLAFAYYSAILGLIQFALKVGAGIKFLTVFSSPAIDSVAGEPSHYAAILTPALVYQWISGSKINYRTLIMLASLLLTLKLTAYFTLAIVLALAYMQLQYWIFLVPLVMFLYSNFIITNEDYALRFLPIYSYLTSREIDTGGQAHLHGTPLSFISNLEVAWYSIRQNPLLGVGFGGHEKAYYDYFTSKGFIGLDYLLGLNARGGHSLTIRLLSETGLLGIATYLITLMRSIIFDKRLLYLHAISLGCLSHFITKTLKLSSYIDYGTPFFFIVLLICAREYRYQYNLSNSWGTFVRYRPM